MTKTCGRCKKDFTTEPDNQGQATCHQCREKLNSWFRTNKERIYERDRDRYAIDGYPYQRRYNQKLREQAIAKYGGKCACCGVEHLEVLCIDHKHGGGDQHRAQLKKTGINIYQFLKKNNYPPGFQVLCWNCNQSLALYGFSPLNPTFQHLSPGSQNKRRINSKTKHMTIQNSFKQVEQHEKTIDQLTPKNPRPTQDNPYVYPSEIYKLAHKI